MTYKVDYLKVGSLNSSGIVGIGVTNPAVKLDIAAASGYVPVVRIGTNTTYVDDQIYSLRFGGSELMGMGLYSSTQTVFGSQGLGIHIPNTEEYSIRTNGWTKLFALDGATQKVYFGGKVGIGVTSPIANLDSRSGVGNSSTSWIAGTFGGTNSYPRVVMGALNSVACIGAHNAALNAWEKIYLNDPSNPVVVDTSGNVGIGTTNPQVKLHVVGTGAGVLGYDDARYFSWSEGLTSTAPYGTTWNGISIYASGDIVTYGYFASHDGFFQASDTRIKKNIVDADDAECLETLRLLKPKKYQYKDEIK
jgi:hypothetical protein